MSLAREELATLPYAMTAEELRRKADEIHGVAVDLLRVALDLRRMADAIDDAAQEGAAKRLAE